MERTKTVRRRRRILRAELVLILCLSGILFGLVRGRLHEEPADMISEPETLLYEPEPLYLEYGTETGTEIDASGFADPDTKNNLDLAVFAEQAWQHQWGYVWGTFGWELDEALLEDKLAQYPDHVEKFEDYIRAHWLGRRTADCVGLIKAYGWFDPATGGIVYDTGGMPDCSTESMFEDAAEKGPVDTIPEIPGIIVYQEGHVGVYMGGGYVIEAQGTEAGVVKTKLSQRTFTHWLKCPYIAYG